MAKRIKNPIEVSIIREDGANIIDLRYGLECDDGLETRSGFSPVLTPAEQATIDSVVTGAIAKIEAHEGIS